MMIPDYIKVEMDKLHKNTPQFIKERYLAYLMSNIVKIKLIDFENLCLTK